MVDYDGIKVTTEVLLKGAMIFTLIDHVFISVLTRIIKPAESGDMRYYPSGRY